MREREREKIREEEDGRGRTRAVTLKSKIIGGVHEGNSITGES